MIKCFSDACTSETPIHYHGDIWNVTDCEFCTCRGGNVQCYTAVCEPAICLDVRTIILCQCCYNVFSLKLYKKQFVAVKICTKMVQGIESKYKAPDQD